MTKTDDSANHEEAHDEAAIRSAVETANAEDEANKKAAGAEDDDEEVEEEDEGAQGDKSDKSKSKEDGGDATEEDEDEEDKSKPGDKSAADFKFKQFSDADPATHISNLEKAYEASSGEGYRLHQENRQLQGRMDSLMQAVAGDQELAEKLEKIMGGKSKSSDDDGKGGDAGAGKGNSPLADPFLADARAKWHKKSLEEVQEILDNNPQLTTDTALGRQVKHWMDIFTKEHQQLNDGELLSAGEAMRQAMKHLGIDEKKQEQQNAAKLKNLAAPTRPTGGKKVTKSTAKKSVSDQAYHFGEAMGVPREKVEAYAK